MKGFVISAPMTGSGKTTLTLGLLAAFAERGLKVQPFKVGPDFIDPGLHELAAGVPSHNLDGWMLTRDTNTQLFSSAMAGKDVAIVEGVMGLFDGADAASNAGSTAEMAIWLDLPIILIVDAFPLARSAAAIVHGFQTFDPQLKIAGVIFNRVAGESHFRLLQDAVQAVPILGWLPHNPEVQINERHLGLLTAGESEARMRVGRMADFIKSHLDLKVLLDAIPTLPEPSGFRIRSSAPTRRVRVALAHDVAFSFYYQANRIVLAEAGADIVEFSPLRDRQMPNADFLYIGGGYPELYRDELAANRAMRESVREFIRSGGRFYAECGGLMYLAQSIDGAEMVGVLPTRIQMTDRLVDFGYCEVTTRANSIFGPAGIRVRGHQFHYSNCDPRSEKPVYEVQQRERAYSEGWRLDNGIASYIHLHFLSNPRVVRAMLHSIDS
jgi:cobyrinic acid a,c-diamide synthase